MDCSRTEDSNKFWSLIERKMGCIVPKYVRNILHLRGFDDPVSVAAITKEDIIDLKSFVKTSMKYLIPEGADQLYYYYLSAYVKKPEEFEIAPGHLKLLQSIIDYIKNQTTIHGHAFFDFYDAEPTKSVICKDKTRKLKNNKNFLLIKSRREQNETGLLSSLTTDATKKFTGSELNISEKSIVEAATDSDKDGAHSLDFDASFDVINREKRDEFDIPDELLQEKKKLYKKVFLWLQNNTGDSFEQIGQKIDEKMIFIYHDKDLIDDDDDIKFKLAFGILCPCCDNPIKASETTKSLENGDDKLYLSLSNFIKHFKKTHLTKSIENKNRNSAAKLVAANSRSLKTGYNKGYKVLKKSKTFGGHRQDRKLKPVADSDETDESVEEFTVTKVYSDGSSEDEVQFRPRKGLKIQSGDQNNSVGNAEKIIRPLPMLREFDELQVSVDSLQSYHHSENLLLKKFLDSSEKNVFRAKPGYRHDFTIKMFACYMKMIGGALSYETWHANMPFCLPSPSTVNKVIADYGPIIIEGEMRIKELEEYLKTRNLPLRVNISEDGTRITPKMCHDPKTNQLVGFALPLDRNGMPKPYSFKARSVKEIQEHYYSNHLSSSVVVQMAQPQVIDCKEDAPPFCLNLFLTDNKFTAEAIQKRWIFTIDKLRERNIIVDNFASDADPKFMKAMKIMSELGVQNLTFLQSEWFSCGGSAVTTFTQDPLHVITKTRNRALKSSRLTQIGSKIISQSHLKYLIDNVSKDKHCLTITDINPKDRQNCLSAEKMCSTKTIDCLFKFVPGCEGTAAYLKAMNNFLCSYLDATLNSSERIYKIWCALFFFRGWRSWLVNCTKRQQKNVPKKDTNYTLKENFLSSICYHAIELNAHTLVKQILSSNVDNLWRGEVFDKSKRVGGYAFAPHLQGSQQCEKMFRQVRSFSSTFSTVVNCSMLDIINRIKKIQLQSDIINCCSNEIKFPRFEKKVENIKTKPSPFISKDECIRLIEKARIDVTDELIKLGMKQDDLDFHCQVSVVKSIDEEVDDYTDDELDFENEDENNLENLLERESEIEGGFQEDINLLHGITGEISLKDYSGAGFDIDKESKYAVVADNSNDGKVVLKSAICWYLQKDYCKLSSDRLQRVQENDVDKTLRNVHGPTASQNHNISPLNHCEEINIGEWCVFAQNETYLIGHILSFCYVGGKMFREREYTKSYATVQSQQIMNDGLSLAESQEQGLSTSSKGIKHKTKPVAVLCSWYRWDSNGFLKSADDKVHEFVLVTHYRGTILKPLFTNNVLRILINAVEALNEFCGKVKDKETAPGEEQLYALLQINVGEYVICTIETEHNRAMRFVGQVKSIEDNGQEYEISFLRRSTNKKSG